MLNRTDGLRHDGTLVVKLAAPSGLQPTRRLVAWCRGSVYRALLVYIASVVSLACCLKSDLQYVGCYLFLPNTTVIDKGKYVERNLSKVTCFRECRVMLKRTPVFALAQQSICLCDSDMKDFEETEKIRDERCLNTCISSLIYTKFCGQLDTMAVYEASSASRCNNLSEPSNGIMSMESSSTVRFSCNDGYILSGNDCLNCQRVNGSWQWSGPVPYCKEPGATEVKRGNLHTVLGVLCTLLIVSVASGVIVKAYLYLKGNGFPWKRKFRIEQIYREEFVNGDVIFNRDLPPREVCSPVARESTGYKGYERISSVLNYPLLPPTPPMHHWCDVSPTDNSTRDIRCGANPFLDKRFQECLLQANGNKGPSAQYTTVNTDKKGSTEFQE